MNSQEERQTVRVAVITGNHKGADIDRILRGLKDQGIEVVTDPSQASHLLEGEELDRVVAQTREQDRRKAVNALSELGISRSDRRMFKGAKAAKKAKFRELQARAFKGE